MTVDDVDAFLAAKPKTLPAAPEWLSNTDRVGERRSYLPIAVSGRVSNVQLCMVTKLRDDGYLVLNLLVPQCVTRLCLSLEHHDRRTMETVEAPHWHPWALNRPKHNSLPKRLDRAVNLSGTVSGRDDAFAWFLDGLRIESPPWPMIWPAKDELF
ncbi:UNVERIFIED_ORG: hypothetical protein ABIC34_003878 [Sphingomonas sp. 1057]